MNETCMNHALNMPNIGCCPYCRIAELEQQLADEKKAAGYWMEQSCKDHNRAEKAEQQISRYQSKYNNLLAVAHRDGGQYLAQHGEEKAGEDAITAILTAYHSNDRYQGNDETAQCDKCGSDMEPVRPGKWQCPKCELEEMIQQAHRQGWEQCQREAVNTCHNHRSDYGIGGEYMADGIGRAIASMEYKGADK